MAFRKDWKLVLIHSFVREEISTTQVMSHSLSRIGSRALISSTQEFPGILSVALSSALHCVEAAPSREPPVSLHDGWEAKSPPFNQLTSSWNVFISWQISFSVSVKDDASVFSKPLFYICTNELFEMLQPSM